MTTPVKSGSISHGDVVICPNVGAGFKPALSRIVETGAGLKPAPTTQCLRQNGRGYPLSTMVAHEI